MRNSEPRAASREREKPTGARHTGWRLPCSRLAARCSLVLLLAAVAYGQSTPPPPPFNEGTIITGQQRVGSDTNGVKSDGEGEGSARLTEYRDVPDGVVIPLLRLTGREGTVRYMLQVENVTARERRTTLRVDTPLLRFAVDGDQVPHRFGFRGVTLEAHTAREKFEIPDAIQQFVQQQIEQQRAIDAKAIDYLFLRDRLAPSMTGAAQVSAGSEWKRGRVDLSTPAGAPFDASIILTDENLTGNHSRIVSFGFANVIELDEPVDSRSREVASTFELPIRRGVVRAGFRYSTYADTIDSYTFENPFRAVGATDALALFAPSPLSGAGASIGRISLEPDNSAISGSVGAVYKLPADTRITADVAVGRWTQRAPLMELTSNPSLLETRTFPSPIPRTLDGSNRTTSLSLFATSRPVKPLSVTMRLRHYALSDSTPRVSFPGYASFDAVWAGPTLQRFPHHWQTTEWDGTASWNAKRWTVEAGARGGSRERTVIGTQCTKESALHGRATFQPLQWARIRLAAERGTRDRYSNTDSPALVRQFDFAGRDSTRLRGELEVFPGERGSAVLSWSDGRETYERALTGLSTTRNRSLSLEGSVEASSRATISGFVTKESASAAQRGNHHGVLTVVDSWTATERSSFTLFGASAAAVLIPELLRLEIGGQLNRNDGRMQFERMLISEPLPLDITAFDDQRRKTVYAELSWRATRSWEIAVGTWIESDIPDDAATGGLTPYMPGAMFLVLNNGEYRANVLYLHGIYRW